MVICVNITKLRYNMAAMLKDRELQKILEAEENRQRDGLELIPSENYVSRDVLTAMGSVFR